jgi:hypothetical protein
VRAGGDVEVGAADDVARPGELRAVREVEHLGLDARGGDVVQGDVARRFADEGGVSDGRADRSRSDDGQFRVLDHAHAFSLAVLPVSCHRPMKVAHADRGHHRPRHEQRSGDESHTVESVEIQRAADDRRQRGDRKEARDACDRVVDRRCDARTRRVGGSQDRRGERRHRDRETESEDDHGGEDLPPVVEISADEQQEKASHRHDEGPTVMNRRGPEAGQDADTRAQCDHEDCGGQAREPGEGRGQPGALLEVHGTTKPLSESAA